MANKIYKLTSLCPKWLPTRTIIIIAKDEQEARKIAEDEKYNTAHGVDWSEANADIEIVSTKKPGVILSDTSD